jgi:hypothetical protein
MTTAAEIKSWTCSLTKGRQDVVLRGRSLWLLPINHVCRSIFFEGSSDRTDPRARWSFKLPFTPLGLPVRVWSAQLPIGRSTDEAFAARVFEQVTGKIDNDLMPVSTIEAFHAMTLEHRPHEAMAGLWQLSRQPEYHACVLAALGRLEEARVVAEECIAPKDRWETGLDRGRALLAKRSNSNEGKYLVSMASDRLQLLSELERLRNVSADGDRSGAAALLREWEEQKIRLWKIEDLWEPSPFPIELGAGD